MYESGTHEVYAVQFPDGKFAQRSENGTPHGGGMIVRWQDDGGNHVACVWDDESTAQHVAEGFEHRARTMGAQDYATSIVLVTVNVTITADVKNAVPLALDDTAAVIHEVETVYGIKVASPDRAYADHEIDLSMVAFDPTGEMIAFYKGMLLPSDIEKFKAAHARALKAKRDEDKKVKK